MLGRTKITLNKETVVKAVQEYLDRQLDARALQTVKSAAAVVGSYANEDFALQIEVEPYSPAEEPSNG